jgi:glutamyl-tRNA synthetase
MNTTRGVRVRFAPSPTGYLHVGGARTALFNWLFARKTGGTFVLRIEDTDRERSNDEMTQVILEGLEWLGLDWDEGPIHQAEGLERHRADALGLLERGAAYRCFCTPEQIEARRKPGDDGFRYDRFCLEHVSAAESAARAAAGESHTVRFRVPDGVTAWDDVVHDTIQFDNASIEDFIILRSDHTPIYNMAVVSDDAHMHITHVLRGDDHISNTPKQIMLYRALGYDEPIFGHVPLINGPDGKRLSKRHGATAVGEYRNQGILPAAMVNFLALLGWSPGTDEEVFMRDELVERFTLEGVNKKSAIFDSKKLLWLNGQHIVRLSAGELFERVQPFLSQRGLVPAGSTTPEPRWLELLDVLKVRARSIDDLAQLAEPFLLELPAYDGAAVAKHWADRSRTVEYLAGLRDVLGRVAVWDHDSLEAALRSHAERIGVGAGRLIHPLRVALIGLANGPGIFEIAHILGREQTLRRIDAAIATIEAHD